MANELISEYVDLDATEKQTKALIDQLERVESKYARLAGIKIDLSGSVGGAAVTTKMKQAADATEDLSKETILLVAAAKERQKIDNALVATSVKIAAADTQEAKALQVLKKELQQVNAEQKNQVRESQAAEGSIEQLRATLIRLQKEYDNLSKADRTGGRGTALKGEIKGLSDELKKLEGDTGRFQRNVGNYANAFGDAFGVLKKNLTDVRAQINSGDFSGDQLNELIQKEELLSAVTEKLSQDFSSTKQQSRAFQEAAASIGTALGQQSEVFQEFRVQVGEGVDSLNDIRDSIKLAASDTGKLDQLIGAASGIAGAFGVAQGAAALFAGESEELEKTMVKLQSALAILNGLQAIQNELKNKDSLLLKAVNFIRGQETKAIVSNTIATEAQAGATAAATVATTGLSTGLKVLRAALITTGIGALIVGISYLVSAISDWVGADEKAIESQKELSAAMAEVLRSQKTQADAYKELRERRIKTLEEESARTKALGSTQISQFAAEAAIAAERQKLAEEQIKIYGITQEKTDKFFKAYVAGLETVKQQEIKLQGYIKAGREDDAENLRKVIDNNKAATENQKAAYDLRQGILKDYSDSKQQIELIDLQRTKFNADESRKYTLESVKIQADTATSINERILSDERSSLDQRLDALKANQQARIAVIKAERNAVLNDPSSSGTARLLATKKAAAEEEKAVKDSLQKQAEAREAYNDRITKAQYDSIRAEIEFRADADAEIAANEMKSVSQQSDALASELAGRIDLIKKGLAAEIAARKGILPEERAALEKKANLEIIGLRSTFITQLIALNNKALANDEANNQAITNRRRDELLAQLADEYNTRQITAEQYEQKKFEVEARYAKQSIQLLIDSTRKQIEVAGISYEAKKELLAKLAAYERELAEKTTTDNEAQADKDFAKRTTLVQNFAKLSADVGNVISELSAIGYEREVAAIESAINALEKKKALDIEVATRSIANEQDRAAAITTIEARAAAEREALERRRRQIEMQRAKTERLLTVGRIIADTAAAVVAALGTKPFSPINYALAAAAGALGAAQVAKVLATPLPQFKGGKDEHNKYEGFAIVGDGGKRERIIREDGSHEITPAVPTLTYVKRNDIILPDADKALKDFTGGRTRVPKTGETSKAESNAGVIQAIERSNQRLVETVKNKDSVNVDISYLGILAWHKYGNDNLKYIQEQTNW